MNIEVMEHHDGWVQVIFDDKPLTCPVCSGQHYHERSFLLNTRGGEFFGLAWAEDKATNFICLRCGYIFWFFIKDVKRSKAEDRPDLPLTDRIFGRAS